MLFAHPPVSLPDVVADVVRLLPEYVPGVESGPAASTEGRSCWIRTWKSLLGVIGRAHGMEVAVQEDGDSALRRQLTMHWNRDGRTLVAIFSGWGSRQDLDDRFRELESFKAPQKVILFSCIKWQEAVIEQLDSAFVAYPYHIEGEQYLALNLMGPSQSLGAHVFTVPHDGPIQGEHRAILMPLPGAPFRWGGAQKEAARSR